jgi:tetratricopeptide (TPR) repeat protein
MKALEDLAEEYSEGELHAKIHTSLFKICIADAINEDPDNRDHHIAIELSKFAFDAMPWNSSILMIYGKALVAVGENEEALKVLKRALTFEMLSASRLEISAIIGLICLSLGKKNEAKSWLKTSKKYKGTHSKQNELIRLMERI